MTPTIAPLFWLVSTKLEEHERDIFRWGELKNIPVVVPQVLQITHQRDHLAFTAAKEQKMFILFLYQWCYVAFKPYINLSPEKTQGIDNY